jgi:hypothetical protein
LDWGPHRAFLETLPEEDRPPPPEVPDWLNWVWRAWNRLHDERPSTVTGFAVPMGAMRLTSRPGRIPWTAVQRWCRHHGLGRDEMAFLDRCIGEMDAEYLAWWGERQASAG